MLAPSVCVVLATAVLCAGSAAAALDGVTDGSKQLTDPETSVGATECQCITAATFPVEHVRHANLLAAKGFPASYGLEGCKAYDENLDPAAKAAVGCTVRTSCHKTFPRLVSSWIVSAPVAYLLF